MDLISVIVPVYKVEAYLDRCVESIVNQTYQDLEIILVDDGSPDKCPEMCDAWAQKDKRIKVIHKENGGLSDARNAGLSCAAGDYICFVDSDDWIHVQFIEALLHAVQTTDSEIAACGVSFVPNGESVGEVQTHDFMIDVNMPEEALGTLIRGEKYRAVAWNKIYKRDILKHEKFEKGKLHEDEFFTYRIIDKCQKLSYVNEKLYYYRQRSGSIMTTFSINHLDALEAGLNRLYFLKGKYPSLYKQDRITFCVACLNYYLGAYRGMYSECGQALDIIKAYRKRIQFSFLDWMELSTKDKLRIMVSAPPLIVLYAYLRSRRD